MVVLDRTCNLMKMQIVISIADLQDRKAGPCIPAWR